MENIQPKLIHMKCFWCDDEHGILECYDVETEKVILLCTNCYLRGPDTIVDFLAYKQKHGI